MDIGMSLFFQSPNFMAENGTGPVGVSDFDVVRRDLELGDLAEPLGFDSLWTVEHHFSGYTLMPDPMQFLAHMAGRTRRITLGTMVVVLPWYHQPVRVAESISLLDNLAEGRLIFGIGRGLGRVEFDGLGVPMDESRSRFVESAELILRGLEQGYVEYDGKHFQQEKRYLRPGPTRSFKGRTFAAAVSPESSKIMAELGVGIITLPQKGWEKTRADLKAYSDLFESIHHEPPPPSKVCCPVFVDEDEGRARDLGLEFIGNYYETVLKFYELAGRHFENTVGYEHYAAAAKEMARRGEDEATKFYAGLQVYGTPDQCVDKIAERQEVLGADTFLGAFNYGGMSRDEMLRNVHLFTDKVVPRAKAL